MPNFKLLGKKNDLRALSVALKADLSARSPAPPLLAACETEEVVLSGNTEDLQLPDRPPFPPSL